MHSATFLTKQLARTYKFVVAQPATYCNLDCDYCYLPHRDRQKVMPEAVAVAIADGIATQDAPHPVTLGWHGGEPLTTGVARFERLLTVFEPLRQQGKTTHALQTNATLINDAWCDLFARYEVALGVSIDGPAQLNVNRLDRKGRETFDRTMLGIARLKAAGIPFNVIAVVSPETIDRADEMLTFFDELAPTTLGFNIEERENANLQRPLVSSADAEAFWRKVIAHRRSTPRLQVREIAQLATYRDIRRGGAATRILRRLLGERRRVKLATRLGIRRRGHQSSRQLLPTISWDGNVVVLSPELAGATAPQFDNFVVGNVLETPLAKILSTVDQVPYVQEFSVGLAKCKASCSMWDACGGVAASNRFFEHGSFAVTATAQCRNRVQALVGALLGEVRTEPSGPASTHTEQILAELAADPD